MYKNKKSHLTKNIIINKLNINAKNGFLDISVFSEDNDPIEGAQVSVYYYVVRGVYGESATENEIVSYITDENGEIPLIELPVIHEFGNLEENIDEYHMRVDAPGYYSVIVMNIEIYAGTTTDYNVTLTPITDGGSSYVRFIIIPERH